MAVARYRMICLVLGQFHVLFIYRSPAVKIRPFLQDLQTLLSSLSSSNRLPLAILGDFNVNALIPESFRSLQGLLQEHGYVQTVQRPTHISGSLIDHVYVQTNVPSATADHMPFLNSLVICFLHLYFKDIISPLVRRSLSLQRTNITLADAADAIAASKDVFSMYDVR